MGESGIKLWLPTEDELSPLSLEATFRTCYRAVFEINEEIPVEMNGIRHAKCLSVR